MRSIDLRNRSELAKERIEVFDLSGLKMNGDNAHDRAFEDITSVAGMVKQRLREGLQMTASRTITD
jgi:hypothetical protein